MITSLATFINIQQVQCTLPEAGRSFSITISNTATSIQSEPVNVLNYDARCYECVDGNTCSRTVSQFV